MVAGFSFALLLAIATSPIQASGQYAAAQTLIPAGPASQSRAAASMIGRIVSFTEWPRPITSLNLCIAGSARFADRLGDIGASSGLTVHTRAIGGNGTVDGCDVLYLGALDAAARGQLIAAAHNKPILTIAEHDPQCRGGAMFCLAVGDGALSFLINLDAISRGRVRVDPRVLRLSDAHGGRP